MCDYNTNINDESDLVQVRIKSVVKFGGEVIGCEDNIAFAW